MKRIVLTGSTGMIGKKIASRLIERGDEITIFTRSVSNTKQIIPNAAEYVEWNYNLSNWQSHLENKDAVIHLAGENVMAHWWNEERKKNILASRVKGTRALVNAFGHLVNKPNVFISASAVGYYGNSEKLVTEDSPSGNDFLSKVVSAWENEAGKIERLGVRRVSIRIGIVLNKNDGALARMIPPFKFFLGGPLGTGEQWFPWIHINDLVGIFLFALDNKNVNGVLNAVSPNPVRMKKFCETLGRVMKRPSFFKVPAFVLKILLGEAAEVLLTGAQVIPKKTLEADYDFKFVEIEKALTDLLR